MATPARTIRNPPLIVEPTFRLGLRDPATDQMYRALVAEDPAALDQAIRAGADINQQLPPPRLAGVFRKVDFDHRRPLEQQDNPLDAIYMMNSLHPVGYALQSGFLDGLRILCEAGINLDECGNIERRLVSSGPDVISTSERGTEQAVLVPLNPPTESAPSRRNTRRPRFTTETQIETSGGSAQTHQQMIDLLARCNLLEETRLVLRTERDFGWAFQRYSSQFLAGDAARAMRALWEVSNGRENGPRFGYAILLDAARSGKCAVLEFLLSPERPVPLQPDYLNALMSHAVPGTRAILQTHRSAFQDSGPAERTSEPSPEPEASHPRRYVPGLFTSSTGGMTPGIAALRPPRTPDAVAPTPISVLFERFCADPELPGDLTVEELHTVFYELLGQPHPNRELREITEQHLTKASTSWMKVTRAFSRFLASNRDEPALSELLRPSGGATAPREETPGEG